MIQLGIQPASWEAIGGRAGPALADQGIGFAGFAERAGRVVRRIEPAGPRVSVVIGFGETITVGERGTDGCDHRAFVVGAASGPLISRHRGELRCIEVDLAPWAAAGLLGRTIGAGDGPVALGELLGRDADTLVERLATALDWPARFALVDTLFSTRLAASDASTRSEIRWAWDQLERSAGAVPIRQLARAIGWSDRHFATRFRDGTGVLPKAAARRLRFDRARRMVDHSALGLADIAAMSGYSDQSHLTREFGRLAGCAPAAYRAARLSDLPGKPADVLGA